jgi:uncharacterized BrkB/YihY/UPF0761 family membrane protein
MSEFPPQTKSNVTLPPIFPAANNLRENQEASSIKSSEGARPVLQQHWQFKLWRSLWQGQIRLLILVYLLLGMSIVSLVLGIVNYLALRSLRLELNQVGNSLHQPQKTP